MFNYQPNHDLLQHKIILVTGAGDGIGREAALTYARHGAQIILLGRTTAKLEAVKQQIENDGGLPVSIYTIDLLTVTAQECQDFSRKLARHYPRLDGVLHNAGLLGVVAPIIEQPAQLWHDVMQVNVNATFMLTQALIPLLLKAPSGALIFTSSSVGREGRSGWGAYSVSKFATEGFMQILAQEYQDTSLRINCINPGGTRTSMRASAFPDENSAKLKTPADIMPVYLYVMGDDSLNDSGISFDAQPGRKAGPAKS
ncbi:YciK family oxidoreductase [Xenorhabdus koppenhoeferi]|uniref:NAD(P)-dependent dehydrogenase, short-chain alcohol dehydrogenase family n=1 Tax=Xenorhabdus koppenhoeferi TaxID=351659 RepID=A0A1I7JIL3_9GAMM|nr:YciK family oxidoreductase [Xenorhabdus koppenhoeferi]SFU85012.1 NAD(P)-dependent dehydrogenase, short-chain alcohol dehydrogenase family [Xenorhabdus koppenhoeferi]